MAWLSDNWVWIALAIGAFFLMTRMGGMGCGMGGMGHQHGGDSPPDDRTDDQTAGTSNATTHRRHGCC